MDGSKNKFKRSPRLNSKHILHKDGPTWHDYVLAKANPERDAVLRERNHELAKEILGWDEARSTRVFGPIKR